MTLENQSQFAKRLGHDKGYITRLKQAGRLVMEGDRVNVEASLARIQATQGDRPQVADYHAEQREHKSASPSWGGVAGMSGGNVSPGADLSLEKARRVRAISEARIKTAQADQEEMARDKMAGNLIAKEDVDFVLRDFGTTLSSHLENLADRLAPIVYPITTLNDTHTAIREMAQEIQLEMAETMQRRTLNPGTRND
ncbi:hypothetical protein [Candidatus Nitrotoga sp. M5]|uniref:hypothetical protein n=1 Tax=Candidatus Nitrotoga sp. M5 TaxID=2890409 RepID=UPI001EF55718|nr:hypothetical protein [Candidatus Nitrotoga sp. M5]CAH1387978.1 conserved hypothetical protein [Candidatus Nitrotoga sp. M5]